MPLIGFCLGFALTYPEYAILEGAKPRRIKTCKDIRIQHSTQVVMAT